MKTWPKLYDKSSTGKIKTWEIAVFEMGKKAEIKIKTGYVDGKIRTLTRVVDKGKNIGKVNSTTPYQQACLEAESKYKRKQDKGYVSQISQVGKKPNYLPMLAKTYYSKNHPRVVKGEVKETKVILPLIIQPKLNGVRCIARKEDGVVYITSRLGKDYAPVCSKLANQLRLVMQNTEIWDGEIYVHGWTFQRIIRAIKKKRADTRKLQFHRYDICDTTLTMRERWQISLTKPENKYIKHVATLPIKQKDEIKHFHDQWVKVGYEGIILRDPKGMYQFGHRVPALLKYKEFIDEEFPISAFKYDIRQDTDDNDNIIQRKCIKFVCYTKNGNHFDVVPQGSLKQRELWWNNPPNTGKKLTVRYQELSEDGRPIFPIGIGVRDYE